MDALDIMTNLDSVLPHFQAIFSADGHTVIGYEVIGRVETQKNIESLSSFFGDDSVPDEYKREVDDIITAKALDMVTSTGEEYLLFLHRDATLLLHDADNQFLSSLLHYEEQGLKLSNIVLEITEHDFQGDLDQLNHLLRYYRTYGIKLALNKVGAGRSNLERISLLNPDILKISLKQLGQNSQFQAHQDILYSLSLLARRIGATLLYEDIDAFYQLQYAWRNGGRYYQGNYLKESLSHFLAVDVLKDRLRGECHDFILHEKRHLQRVYDVTNHLQAYIEQILLKHPQGKDLNKWLLQCANEIGNYGFRLYICDEDGFQQCGNVMRKSGNWAIYPEYHQKNWSWRPYFLENIMKLRTDKKGRLSDAYADIETGETIRTFSFPIEDNRYLFIDLTYEFLFEQDIMR